MTREDQVSTVAAVIWGADTSDANRIAGRVMDALFGLGDKITLTFDDTPGMRAALRQLAERALDLQDGEVDDEYTTFDAVVTAAIDVDEPGALMVPLPERDPMEDFVQAVTEAAVTYDATGEHMPCRPLDCARCRVVDALPKSVQDRLANAPRQRERR